MEVMHDGGIPAARTDNRVPDAMLHKQCRQYIYVLFIAIHPYNYNYE